MESLLPPNVPLYTVLSPALGVWTPEASLWAQVQNTHTHTHAHACTHTHSLPFAQISYSIFGKEIPGLFLTLHVHVHTPITKSTSVGAVGDPVVK